MLPVDCIRNADSCMKALHSVADLWFGRLSLSTKVVAVGLILEAPELVFEIWAIIRRKIDKWKFHITFPESHAPDWVKVVAFLGWILIVGGVVGEWVTEGKVNEADTSILELNDDLLSVTTKEAGDANKLAADANERTANVELEALKLQQQLIAQGSRSALLFGKNSNIFVAKLKSFRGQKVEVRHCRVSLSQFFVDNDTMQLVMRLQTILETDAKWAVTPYVEDNCSGTGVEVSVSPKAPESTRKTACALWNALHEIPLTMLGDKPFVMQSPRPQQPKMYDCGTTSKCENREVVLPPLGADTIVLTVLSHP
jgi:hypothetical protein